MTVAILNASVLTTADTDPAAFSVSAGSNRILLEFTAFNGAGDTMTALTYGNQPMTLVAVTVENQSRIMYAWYLDEAGIAAAEDNIFRPTYVGSPAGARMHHVVVAVSNASQSAPSGVVTSDGDEPQTLAFTAQADAYGFSMVYSSDATNSWTWNNSWVERHDQSITGGTSSFGQKALSAGSETASVTPVDGTSANHMIAVMIQTATPPSTVAVSSVGAEDVVFDNELRVEVNGTDFEALQGTGTVQLHNTDPDETTPTTSVTQSIRSWSDRLIVIDVDKSTLGDNVFLEVTADSNGSAVIPLTVLDDTGTAPATRAAIPGQSFTEGVPFSLDVTGKFHHSNVQDSLTFSATGLPTGLSISEGGVISGTIDAGADASSPFSTVITVTDLDGNDITDAVSWTVTAATTVGESGTDVRKRRVREGRTGVCRLGRR